MLGKLRVFWENWRRKAIASAVVAVAGAIAIDAYVAFKSGASALGSALSSVGVLPRDIQLQVTPVFRRSGFHGFWPFGHTDYAIDYRAEIVNYSYTAGMRVRLQIKTSDGFIVRTSFPPVSRARLLAGANQSEWNDWHHSEAMQVLAFEFDLPSPGSSVSIGLSSIRSGGFPADEAVSVQLMLPDRVLLSTGQKMTWK